MRAASTGGGLVCFVVIWLVVLTVLVMTAAGASSTAASATVTATATITAATAVHRTTTTPPATTSADDVAAAKRALAAEKNATVTADRKVACEKVRVSVRKPACSGQISEGPGPPMPPPSRCPTATCAESRGDRSSDNNKNKNINNNDNVNNYDKNINNNSNINYNDNDNIDNNNNSNHQCLEYVRPELIPEMCPDDRTAYLRPGRLSRYRLRHCCHHTVESVVQKPYDDRSSCVEQVNEAMLMDSIAAAMSCQFNEVLARYDCKQKYSAKSCDLCKDAYALWACSAVLPHWTRQTTTTTATTTTTTTTATATTANRAAAASTESTAAQLGRRYRVNACQSVCLAAEQTCPWLLPVADDANPYAGEAAFTCMDPDIGYQMSSTDARRDCCYEHCDDRLCVRNASMCIVEGAGDVGSLGRGGEVYGDQRPVCLDHSGKLPDDESECDFDAAVSGSGGLLMTAAAAFWCLTRTALIAAVT